MSELRRVAPPAAEAAPEQKDLGWARGIWFGWWVALCLVVLAYNTYGQLAAQRRILAGSQQLKEKVAEAAAVSAATNHQLGKVAELDAATTALAGTLKRLAETNVGIKSELGGMEATVGGLIQSLERLDVQAVASHETLTAITRESDSLLAVLRRSQSTSAAVSGRLSEMVKLQVGINADLDEMNRNTQDLDRFLGGN